MKAYVYIKNLQLQYDTVQLYLEIQIVKGGSINQTISISVDSAETINSQIVAETIAVIKRIYEIDVLPENVTLFGGAVSIVLATKIDVVSVKIDTATTDITALKLQSTKNPITS